MHFWESYSSAIIDEYRQSVDEGLDIEEYKDIFFDISKLPQGAIKKKFGDVIFEIITEAKKRENYKYNEPSTLEEIKALSKPHNMGKKSIPIVLKAKSKVPGSEGYVAVCSEKV